MYHTYVCYYDHFEDDVNMCLTLHNSYLTKRLGLLEKKSTKDAARSKSYDGKIFRREKTKAFLKKIDHKFAEAFDSLANEFKNHSDPIVCSPLANKQ